MGIRGRLAVFALAFAALAPSLARAEDPPCLRFPGGLDQKIRHPPLEVVYPEAEQYREDEDWTSFAVTIEPDGTIGEIWQRDALGGDAFGRAAAAAIAKAKYAPAPMLNGKPARLGHSFEVAFRLDPIERGGVHNYYSETYDRARMARERRDYAASVRILKDSLPWPHDLYELTTMSYALAVSYQGLNDWRRATRHIRHATISNGVYADKGVRAAALAMTTELNARDHNYRWAKCAYDALKKQYPDRQDSPTLAAAAAETDAALGGVAPIRTEVEILEQDRADLMPHWWHLLSRPSFAIENVQGAVKSYRLDCLGHTERGPVVLGARVAMPFGMRCDLYVMGDPGAKFVLDER